MITTCVLQLLAMRQLRHQLHSISTPESKWRLVRVVVNYYREKKNNASTTTNSDAHNKVDVNRRRAQNEAIFFLGMFHK